MFKQIGGHAGNTLEPFGGFLQIGQTAVGGMLSDKVVVVVVGQLLLLIQPIR